MMKNRTLSAKSIALFLVLLFGAAVQHSFAQFSLNESPLPVSKEPVNDFANVIDDATERELNQKIKAFKLKTNPQVVLAVATVKTTNGRPIEEYSLAVYRGWKIGTNADDNPGALLFIAVDDRKYFTQVGKDLEDELPDGLVGQIQRQYLVPAFKQGDYTKGVSDTIDAYIRAIEAKQTGEPIPQTTATQEEKNPVSSYSFVLCLIVLFILLLVIFSRAGKSNRDRNDRDRWGGGGFGGGGSALPWVIGSIISNSGSSSSSSSDWGGGSSGGGSDWGGFGGGGDAGGGGAGGGW